MSSIQLKDIHMSPEDFHASVKEGLALRDIRTCKLIKRHKYDGFGIPEIKKIDGFTICMGYAGNTDEPCEICKVCHANEFYENE